MGLALLDNSIPVDILAPVVTTSDLGIGATIFEVPIDRIRVSGAKQMRGFLITSQVKVEYVSVLGHRNAIFHCISLLLLVISN